MSESLTRAAHASKPSALTKELTVGSEHGAKPAFIGTGRARDIAVNAVLPWMHCVRMLVGDTSGAAETMELYRTFGPLPDNEITRTLALELQDPGWGRTANNARRQQGLIHLQRILAGATAR